MKFKGILLACLTLIFSKQLSAKNITNGVLNFSMAETGKKYIPLNGDWEFYANQTFTSLLGAQLRVDFIEAPASWTKKNPQKAPIPSKGCNTYRIIINGLRPNFEYAIFSRRSPNYSAMIYANGQFIAEYGKFSRHKVNYKAAQVPMYCRIMSNESGFIELVIQVSNFTGSKGGIVSPIFFGEDEVISDIFLRVMIITASIIGAIMFTFLMNLYFWLFNRSKNTNLYFAIILFFLGIRFITYNFNVLGLIGLAPPFNLQFKLQNIVILSGALFGILYSPDKAFSLKYPAADKMASALSFAILIIFICLPESVSMFILHASFAWAGLFALYSLIRIIYAIKKQQTIIAIYAAFYIVVAIPITIDYFFSTPWTDSHFYLSEIATVIMLIFDITYMAAYLEILQKKSMRLKEESSRYHFAARRFIPHNLQKLTTNKVFASYELGNNVEEPMTIMFVGFNVISPDNTQISLRDNFEARAFYSAAIIDQIDQNNGSVISITNQGISALFKSGTKSPFEAARKIRDLVQAVNARRAEDYYPCITFNISIHQGDILLGLVGDRTRTEFTMVSSSIEVIDKMCNLGFAMNIPILISEPTLKNFGDKSSLKLKLLGKIHFSEFTRPIGLYGMISSEEEENSLESLEENPFITQYEADKYINF